ncbi:MAG: hypothetical protein CL609_03515 [Anaerolineaceae bacterium]|nr:hypothetical protein [Anaerolineaceae bacterium]
MSNGNRSGVSRDLLVRGIAAAKVGEAKEARFYLEWYLNFEPPIKERVDAYYYLAKISETAEQKRHYIELMIALDPIDARARRELVILNGELTEEEIVNPDQLPAISEKQQPGRGDRFTCPSCGGRMVFAPDGQTLTCEYCEVNARLEQQQSGVQDADFFLALATTKGHLAAQNTRVVFCEGCGVQFIVPPKEMTWTCPYCESNYVQSRSADRELTQPSAILPFEVSKRTALQRFNLWRKNQTLTDQGRLDSLQGMYLPMWTFDIGGFLSWWVEIYKHRDWEDEQGDKGVYYDDLRIPATRKYHTLLPELLAGYNFNQLVPFKNDYLVSWMAESYEITAGDAALLAREAALKQERGKVEALQQYRYKNLRLNTARMTVEQYKLVLVPVWVIHFSLAEQHLVLLMNGQSGVVVWDSKQLPGEEKDGLFSRFMDWLD